MKKGTCRPSKLQCISLRQSSGYVVQIVKFGRATFATNIVKPSRHRYMSVHLCWFVYADVPWFTAYFCVDCEGRGLYYVYISGMFPFGPEICLIPTITLQSRVGDCRSHPEKERQISVDTLSISCGCYCIWHISVINDIIFYIIKFAGVWVTLLFYPSQQVIIPV